MSRDVLAQVVARAIGDAAFRQLLRTNPNAALREFKLSPDERSAITSSDPAKLVALGVDQRMSRMFVVPDEVSAFASRTDASDASATPRADIDPGAAGITTARTPSGIDASTQLGRIEGMLDVGGSAVVEGGTELSGGELVAPPLDEFRTAGGAARDWPGDSLPADAMGTDQAWPGDSLHADAMGAPSEALDTSIIDAGAPTLSGPELVAPAVDEFRTAGATHADTVAGDSTPAVLPYQQSAGTEGLDLSTIDAGAPTGSASATLASEADALDLSMIDAGSKDAVSGARYAPELDHGGEGAGIDVSPGGGEAGAAETVAGDSTPSVLPYQESVETQVEATDTQITSDVEPTEF